MNETKRIVEYVPNLEKLFLSQRIPFGNYNENAIVLLSELESIRSYEFINDEKKNILDDILLFENKIKDIGEKIPDC